MYHTGASAAALAPLMGEPAPPLIGQRLIDVVNHLIVQSPWKPGVRLLEWSQMRFVAPGLAVCVCVCVSKGPVCVLKSSFCYLTDDILAGSHHGLF